MEIKITKKDVLWGYMAQFFNIGAGILILPFILKLLPTEILGVWYIFITISGFVQMLDFGFQPTFSRNVAYVFSGATKLVAHGLDNQVPPLSEPNYPLLKNLIKTMKQFYGMVSLAIVFILLTAGSWYIHYKTHALPAYQEIMISWFIYTISTIINFYYSYYIALLSGRGYIKETNQIVIITRMIYILLAAIGLLQGYGLIAVASANLLSIFINRILASRFFYKKKLKQTLKDTITTSEKLLPIIWFNAKKYGLCNLGSFFIQRGNLLFVSMFLSLETVANYGLSINLINIIASISPLYLSTHLPEIYKDRIKQNMPEIRRIFGESILVYYLLYVSGAIILLTLGNFCLDLFHSKTHLLPFLPLLLMIFIQFLETNHSMAATLIATRNEVPYYKAALISGIIIGILVFCSLRFTNLGVTGAIIVPGIVQLCYNNWKWPMMAGHELQMNYFQLINIGFLSLKGWFLRHIPFSPAKKRR